MDLLTSALHYYRIAPDRISEEMIKAQTEAMWNCTQISPCICRVGDLILMSFHHDDECGWQWVVFIMTSCMISQGFIVHVHLIYGVVHLSHKIHSESSKHIFHFLDMRISVPVSLVSIAVCINRSNSMIFFHKVSQSALGWVQITSIVTCSTRWSLLLWSKPWSGTAVLEFPLNTATGSEAMIWVPVRSATVWM